MSRPWFRDRLWNFEHGLLASFAKARRQIDIFSITKVALHSKTVPHSSATFGPMQKMGISHAADNVLIQI